MPSMSRRECASHDSRSSRLLRRDASCLLHLARLSNTSTIGRASNGNERHHLGGSGVFTGYSEYDDSSVDALIDYKNLLEDNIYALSSLLEQGCTVAAQYFDTGRGDLDGWISQVREILGMES